MLLSATIQSGITISPRLIMLPVRGSSIIKGIPWESGIGRTKTACAHFASVVAGGKGRQEAGADSNIRRTVQLAGSTSSFLRPNRIASGACQLEPRRRMGTTFVRAMSEGSGTDENSPGVEDRPFLVTTPLFYVNAAPHMGSAYPTMAADALARFQVRQRHQCGQLPPTSDDKCGC